MRSTRVLLVLALAVLATASQPQCDDARAQCEADCAAQSLVATSFLCRDTPFGSLQSCTCGQQEASQGNTQEVPQETVDPTAAVGFPVPFSWFPGVSSSSADSSSSSSSSGSSDTGIMVIDGPRRLGPQGVWMPVDMPAPMGGAQDPFAAARIAILSNLLQQQRAAPVLALQFDLQRMSDSGQEEEDMHMRMRMHHHDHHHEREEEDDDDDDMDDEPPCLMGLAVLAALVFTSAFVCTRALRLMLARTAQPRTLVAQPAIFLDASDDLASPLLVVHHEKA